MGRSPVSAVLAADGAENTAKAALLNVLFLVADDLRYQFGYEGPGVVGPRMHTPNIDSLANRSLVLHKNYAQMALCSPSRSSVMTGRRPDVTRVYDLNSHWRDTGGNFTTLPEWFQEQGYYSLNLGKIYHRSCRVAEEGVTDPGVCWSSVPPSNQVWARTDTIDDDQPYSWSFPVWHPSHEPTPDGGDMSLHAWTSVEPEEEAAHPLPDTQTADLAVNVLGLKRMLVAHPDKGVLDPSVPCSEAPAKSSCEALLSGTKKLFLAVGWARPHLPFVAPRRFFEMYPEHPDLAGVTSPPVGMPADAWSASYEMCSYSDLQNKTGLSKLVSDGPRMPDKHAKQLRRAYYASVSHVDFEMGRVIAALEEGPFANNTVVVFWGDHGYHLGDLGIWAKMTNFEVAAAAPLMIHAPGLVPMGGIHSQAYTEHIDIFPTVAELATGISISECPDGEEVMTTKLCSMGRSLAPLFSGDSSQFTAAFSQFNRDNGGDPTRVVSPCKTGLNGTWCRMGYTVVTTIHGREMRYTEWVEYDKHKPNFGGGVVGVELYDHSGQPHPHSEAVNLHNATGYAEYASELSKLLRRGPTKPGSWGAWSASLTA